MADWVLVKDLSNHVDQSVQIRGWVHSFRSSGKIAFIEVRDGSGYVQAVVSKKEVDEASLEELSGISHECAVYLDGKVAAHPKKENVFELHVSSLKKVTESEEFPISRKEHGADFLLSNRHLWLRSRKQWAIQRIRNSIINATYDFFRDNAFIKIDSPIITSVACEGTTTLFDFEYFDLGKGYLSQSGQLYLEAAISAHGRVFDFGPVFRAERSKTRKHLIEFWMMDAEMAFFEHDDNLKLQERMISYIIQTALENEKEALEIMERDTTLLKKVTGTFPRITHAEIVAKLRELGSEITEADDLGAPDEALLEKMYDVPVFIEKWPADIKAFYMKRDPENEKLVLAADLMAPEGFGEIIGGSQREDDLSLLTSRMEDEDMPKDKLQWYIDTRRYGSVPHSGFGFGLERLVAWISGAEHIRETIPFPRLLYRMEP